MTAHHFHRDVCAKSQTLSLFHCKGRIIKAASTCGILIIKINAIVAQEVATSLNRTFTTPSLLLLLLFPRSR